MEDSLPLTREPRCPVRHDTTALSRSGKRVREGRGEGGGERGEGRGERGEGRGGRGSRVGGGKGGEDDGYISS